MTHHALLFVPPAQVRDRIVGGLSLLGRARRVVGAAVTDSGMEIVIRGESERAARARDAGEVREITLEAARSRPRLVVFGEVVVDRRIVASLAEVAVADDEIVTATTSSGPSNVYLLGADAMRALSDADVTDLAAFQRFVGARAVRTIAPAFDTASYAEVVLDDASASRATDLLFLGCIKSFDGIISKAINRKISIPISKRLAPTSVTPNVITVICLLIALASASVALVGTKLALAIAGTLFQMNSVLDGVDGELARVKWAFSRLGAFLDTIGDDVSNFAYFGALVYVAHTHGEPMLAKIGALGLVIWLVYLVFLFASLRGTGSGDVMSVSQKAAREAEGFWKKVVETASRLLRRDSFVFLAFVLALVGHATYILPVVFVGATSSFVFAIVETVKRVTRSSGT